ncbi:hypothetical protein [Roseibium sp. RKSG952]|uniref:hypothetical protein n=1 Tax=Roseibium sp. RKSG952 TaxID=2529384 RepID=UPI0012BBE53D|nr:hypothetical protein [Roseibium sp. RKSG952]MTH95774.1 hypothetical protein [Roseibium sp. RKSG952]
MRNTEFISEKTSINNSLFDLRSASPEAERIVGTRLEDNVLNRSPLKNVETSMLFTYMHRRFGLGNVSTDDHKDLGAGWAITTPHQNLALLVTPSFSGVKSSSFLPIVVGDEPIERSSVSGAFLEELAGAYERALLDLLRPVCQRDHYFNALGEIDEGINPVPEWSVVSDDGNLEIAGKLPRFHPTCGTGMPIGLFGGRLWKRLLAISRAAGNGDLIEGLELLVEEKAQAGHIRNLETIRSQDVDILPLVIMGLRTSGDEDVERLIGRLDENEYTEERVAEFTRVAFNRGTDGAASEWLLSLRPHNIWSARQCVQQLGISDQGLRRSLDKLLHVQRVTSAWKDFTTLTEGTINDDLVPDFPWPTEEAISKFSNNLENAGETKLSAWAANLCETKQGIAAMTQILGTLILRKREERVNEEAFAPK